MKNAVSLMILIALLFSCDDAQVSNIQVEEDVVPHLRYYNSGELLSETYYRNKKKEGIGKRFYRNGNVQMEAYYEAGKKQGEGKYYYQDGSLYRLNHYKDDALHGEQIKYRPNGKLMSRQSYKLGYPSVFLEEYNRSGKKRVRYPQVRSAVEHNSPHEGYFTIRFYFEETHYKDLFYIGKLDADGFLHAGLRELPNTDGIAFYTDKYPEEEVKISFSFPVVGSKYTAYKNQYIVEHELHYEL